MAKNLRPLPNRNEILGWGADLDAKKRPAYPMETNNETVTDERGKDYREGVPKQKPEGLVLVSTEHKGLTPIFGNQCPPKGLSGLVRRFAFQFSEGQKAHWLLLLLADRFDVYENIVGAILKGEPDNPLSEMGLSSELKNRAFLKRFDPKRADTRRLAVEGLLLGAGVSLGLRALKSFRKAA